MLETVFVSQTSYHKAKTAFTQASEETGFLFQPVEDEENALAGNIRENAVRAFIADIVPYRSALYKALPIGGVIARFGVGHDSVDKSLATANGIWVANTPGVLDTSVAEQAIWFIGSLARRIPQLHSDTIQGGWKPSPGIEVAGKTLAVLGFGRIGQQLARKAALGLGMRVLACDVLTEKEFAKVNRKPMHEILAETGAESYTNDRNAVLAEADFVSLHMAAVPATRHIAGSGFFAAMKRGAFLLNTARGSLVDENALYDALLSGQLGGAALDVFENEPYEPVDPSRDLRMLSTIVMTPHIGSNTADSNYAMALTAARTTAHILKHGPKDVSNVVNPAA